MPVPIELRLIKSKEELEFSEKIFNVIRVRFIDAVDHMEFHPSSASEGGIFI